ARHSPARGIRRGVRSSAASCYGNSHEGKKGNAKKRLVKWDTAVVLLIITAIPAIAGSWDVCIDRTNINESGTVTIHGTVRSEFTAGIPIFAAGTFSAGQRSALLKAF